ncbi:MAG: M48 family metallopeptidase, partial [Planctomycetes bacterium]|nr:M48 family metallopeptidase [Planctomycetota bacterium]
MASPPRSSLATRAALAVLLLVGFYVFALALAALLVWWPFSGLTAPMQLAVPSILGAAIILWSLVPRIDRFEPPGKLLTASEHPRLFAELAAVASRTGQAMPSEVYLVNDVNAFVAQRGGVMGFGSRRVMGIGLPLLHGLTVAELRAVVAHEFGHFDGGDTRLGPWIHKTRSAIGRTMTNLERGDHAILRKPFELYAGFFLRVTKGISREQELAADRLAA